MNLNTPLMIASTIAIRPERTAPLRAENLIRDLYQREETNFKRTPWRPSEEKINRANAKRERKGGA